MASHSNGQLSLPSLTQQQILITSHNSDTKAIVHSENEPNGFHLITIKWLSAFYTPHPSFLPDLNEDDIKSHDALLKALMSLVNPAGNILRCVDFSPSYRCAMHRTQSLDYGTVIAGSIDMVLDSGDISHLKAGDVVVQRATNHQWINTSETEWPRMMFVLQGTTPLVVGETTLGGDLGEGADLLPKTA